MTVTAWTREPQEAFDVIKDWRYIALHTIAAAAFIFLLQRYGLNASMESALLWAFTFGGCAAGLAYMQSKRGS